jgi:hypothetical protein
VSIGCNAIFTSRVAAIIRPIDPRLIMRVGRSEREKYLGRLTRLRVPREAVVVVSHPAVDLDQMLEARFIRGECSKNKIFHEYL